MYLSGWQNKKIAVVGLGLTGQSCLRFLLQQCQFAPARIQAFDTRENLQLDEGFHQDLAGVKPQLGPLDADALAQVDIIVLSPGMAKAHPAMANALQAGVKVVGDIELFARCNDRPVLAVTGSNGKSTVVSLVHRILNDAGKTALLGGNIGIPALDLLSQPGEVVVLELSSFQLETTYSLSPRIACILNISPDHMDRYPDFAAYIASKQRIYRAAQCYVANKDDANTLPQSGFIRGWEFSGQPQAWQMGLQPDPLAITLDGEVLMPASTAGLSGLHNLANIQVALAMTLEMGVELNSALASIAAFTGLAHRCETVVQKDGVRWINDSKATNVGATLAAIQGIRPVTRGNLVLVAGGDSKQADLQPLQSALTKHVDQLIVLGKDASAIASLKPDSIVVSSIEQAVSKAAAQVNDGDTVLLSPACASTDMFKNYQERGEQFAAAVQALL